MTIYKWNVYDYLQCEHFTAQLSFHMVAVSGINLNNALHATKVYFKDSQVRNFTNNSFLNVSRTLCHRSLVRSAVLF